MRACKRVRVLNAVRRPEVGLLLTSAQYEYLGPQRLLLRLLAQQQHLLALRLSEFLRLPKMQAAVVHHWGRCKIHQVAATYGDEQLEAALLVKLRACPTGSHAELAAEAHHVGRRSLALRLVAHEMHATRQVPLLLHMGEPQLALEKARTCFDSYLATYSPAPLLATSLTLPPWPFLAFSGQPLGRHGVALPRGAARQRQSAR